MKTFEVLVGLSKQSLGLLDADDELVERDEGLLHAVKGALYSIDETEASLTPEEERGRRGFLR